MHTDYKKARLCRISTVKQQFLRVSNRLGFPSLKPGLDGRALRKNINIKSTPLALQSAFRKRVFLKELLRKATLTLDVIRFPLDDASDDALYEERVVLLQSFLEHLITSKTEPK